MGQNVQEKFDNPSKLFIWAFSIGNFIRGRSYYKELLKEINLSGNESVLEFGSGVGSFAKQLASKLQPQGQLTCVDVSPKLLDHTKGKLKNYSNIGYFQGDITNSSFPDNSFDIIVSTWVLHHVEKSLLEQTIKKLGDLLKENGKIFIIEFPDSNIKHTNLSQIELLNIFKQANLTFNIIFSKKHGILYEFSKSS